MSDVKDMIVAVQAQQESIQQLADSVGALAQCVAMLMEEEFATPVKEPEVETDLDGNPVK